MAAAAALQAVPQQPDIASRAMIVKIKSGKLGNSRKVRASQIVEADSDSSGLPLFDSVEKAIAVNADKGRVRVSKQLFDADAFRAIGNLDGLIRRRVAELALPFDTSEHFIPFELVEKLDAELEVFAEKRTKLVDEFLAVYEDLLGEQKGALRGLHNPTDYKDVDEARAEFFFSWSFISFAVPGQLATISKKIWRGEREKAAQTMRNAAAEISQVLRASLLELVSGMRDRLDTPDGKPRIFGPAVRNLADFITTFDFRNLGDDEDLATLVADARNLMTGVSADSLKDAEALRSKVRAGMNGIATKLSGMVIERPARRIKLGDE